MTPPFTTVGSIAPASSRAATIEVVVVLPWVPATATLDLSRISSASISARRTTGRLRARAASSSGLPGLIAEEMTTTLAPSRFSAFWPMKTVAPWVSSRAVIGEGDTSFETKWSRSGSQSIYVLNDPLGIRGVAIAPDTRSAGEVTETIAAGLNYTSRHRCPRKGQVAVFENTAGRFLAAKVVDGRSDTSAGVTLTELAEIMQSLGATVAYNLDGVDKLVLNGDTLAKIFQGQITKWNDPAIAALNSGATLPDTAITPIYRSDSSGTTDNFQKYLKAAAPQTWTKDAGSEFQGGAGEGASKSAGVTQAVQATPGSIGYVEKGFAQQAGLKFAQIDTGAGAVELNAETAGKAIDAAKFAAEGNDLTLDLNSLYGTKEAGAYPLVLATYEIVCSAGYDADTSAAVKSFLTVAANDGQGGLSSAGYVPLPEKFKERLLTSIDAIK